MIPGYNIIDDHSVYTDWIPRQADNVIIQFEVLGLSASGSVDVTPYTKSADDNAMSSQVQATSAPATPASVTLNSKGLFELKLDQADLKDELRLKIEGVSGGGGSDWVNFRIIDMIWFDTAS